MKVRRARQLLWTASGVLLSASIVVGVIAVKLPLELPHTLASVAPPKADALTNATAAGLDELLADANRKLQAPLFDPPPAPVAPAAATPLSLRLTGTIVEPGKSVAMLVGHDGKLLFRGVGEKAAGAEVLSIEPQSVTLRYLGAPVQLRLEKPKGGT